MPSDAHFRLAGFPAMGWRIIRQILSTVNGVKSKVSRTATVKTACQDCINLADENSGAASVESTKVWSGGIQNRPSQVGTDRAIKRTANTEANAAQTADAGKTAGQGVHITDSARQLAALEQAIRSMPEVNEAKVAEIRL